jgi:uncharacterized protein (DUF697 family)
MTAYVWGERDVTNPDITMFNQLKIVCVLQDWMVPTTAFQGTISDALEAKEQLTVWLDFVTPDIIETIIDLDVKVKATYQSSTVVSNIVAALDAEFALGVVKLGTTIRGSDVIATIENIIGVDYCYVDFRHKEIMVPAAGDGFNLAFTKTCHLNPVKANTVKIYKNATLVGADNGATVITGATLSGSVDYTTGAVTVTFNGGQAPALGEVIRVYYQQDEDGDLVPGPQEIVRLVDKNITVL